jgi:hypothetical protein
MHDRTYFAGEPRSGDMQLKSGETLDLGDVRVKSDPKAWPTYGASGSSSRQIILVGIAASGKYKMAQQFVRPARPARDDSQHAGPFGTFFRVRM